MSSFINASNIVQVVSAYRVNSNISSASLTLLFFDFLLTLNSEIKQIWWHKGTVATYLFFCIRYAALISGVLILTDGFFLNARQVCIDVNAVQQGLSILIQLALTSTFSLRLYALYRRSWSVVVALYMIGLAAPALQIYYLTISYVTALPTDIGLGMSGCIRHSDNVPFAHTVILLTCTFEVIFDGIVLIMTLVKTLGISYNFHKFNMQSTVVHVLARDGILYFLALTAVRFINFIIILRQSSTLPLQQWSDLVSAALTARFMISLRAINEPKSKKYFSGSQSISQFVATPKSEKTVSVPSILGNLAQPLHTEIGRDISKNGELKEGVILIRIDRDVESLEDYHHLRQDSNATNSETLGPWTSDLRSSESSHVDSFEYDRSTESSPPQSSDPLHGKYYAPVSKEEEWQGHAREGSLSRNTTADSRTTIHGVIRGQVDGAPQLVPLFFMSTESGSVPPPVPPKDIPL